MVGEGVAQCGDQQSPTRNQSHNFATTKTPGAAPTQHGLLVGSWVRQGSGSWQAAHLEQGLLHREMGTPGSGSDRAHSPSESGSGGTDCLWCSRPCGSKSQGALAAACPSPTDSGATISEGADPVWPPSESPTATTSVTLRTAFGRCDPSSEEPNRSVGRRGERGSAGASVGMMRGMMPGMSL